MGLARKAFPPLGCVGPISFANPSVRVSESTAPRRWVAPRRGYAASSMSGLAVERQTSP